MIEKTPSIDFVKGRPALEMEGRRSALRQAMPILIKGRHVTHNMCVFCGWC
jgi:hypothetical protein